MDDVRATAAQGKGQRAEELLRNELLQEVFKGLQDDYINNWKITSVKDTQAREALWLAVNILGKIQDHIKLFATNGRLATKHLAQIKYPKP